ncbi:hypothetical protein Tco_0289812 [Tanacetum coccineum]
MDSKLCGWYNGIKYEMHKVPWWNVEEDDKSLYLLCAMPTQSEQYPSRTRVTEYEEFVLHEEYMFQSTPMMKSTKRRTCQETGDPFQGYAFEIFLTARLFDVEDAKQHKTSELWTIRIPKKKGECVQIVGGNLLFYTKDICKPTL